MKIVKSAQHYTETAIDEIKLLRSVCQLRSVVQKIGTRNAAFIFEYLSVSTTLLKSFRWIFIKY